jgi:hypothetical protein
MEININPSYLFPLYEQKDQKLLIQMIFDELEDR